jgi:kinesin family member C2/C3
VFTPEDVMEMMSRGARNRAVGETKMNERSSRSHQILTVIVDGYNRVTGTRSHGCLHLVDLAGSERVAKSEATGRRAAALWLRLVQEQMLGSVGTVEGNVGVL